MMDEIIEISLDSADGIIDCRLEPQVHDGVQSYNVTILYPNIVNGYSRSEIYCHNMVLQAKEYVFDPSEEDVHPKIKKLEAQLSNSIRNPQ